MRARGLRDVRFITPTALSYGSQTEEPNADMIFGMPGEGAGDVADSLRLARELADLGARIHAHTFMPLPGTPWRDAPAGAVDPATIQEVDRLSQHGALYGQWQKQRDHAVRLAAAAQAYPRPGRSRTILPTLPSSHRRGC